MQQLSVIKMGLTVSTIFSLSTYTMQRRTLEYFEERYGYMYDAVDRSAKHHKKQLFKQSKFGKKQLPYPSIVTPDQYVLIDATQKYEARLYERRKNQGVKLRLQKAGLKAITHALEHSDLH